MGDDDGSADGPVRRRKGDRTLSTANERARRLLRSLADRRKELGMSQTVVAADMGTSQSSLARMEGGEVDPKISTVERFALALGDEVIHRPSETVPRRSRGRQRR